MPEVRPKSISFVRVGWKVDRVERGAVAPPLTPVPLKPAVYQPLTTIHNGFLQLNLGDIKCRHLHIQVDTCRQ